MKCPYCGASNASRVISTTHDARGGTRRRRQCRQCGQRFSTYEYPVQTMPLVVKVNGSREGFDRDKLIRSIRIACAKRPVPASDIERLVDDIEAHLRQLNQVEVPSRMIGDMVVEGLRELDEIAYIRYVIVFKELDTLQAVHEEIDRLLMARAERRDGHGSDERADEKKPAHNRLAEFDVNEREGVLPATPREGFTGISLQSEAEEAVDE